MLTRVLVFVALLPSAAFAQPVVLDQGFKRVVIWNSDSDRVAGRKLIDAGVTALDVLLPLIACAPEAGVRAEILEGKRFSESNLVVIVDGDDVGCKGYVEAFYLPIDAR